MIIDLGFSFGYLALYMGRAMEVRLSCYLVLLSADIAKAGNKAFASPWPYPYDDRLPMETEIRNHCSRTVHRKLIVAIMPAFSSLTAPQVVLMAICRAASGEKVGIMTTLIFIILSMDLIIQCQTSIRYWNISPAKCKLSVFCSVLIEYI